MSLVKRKALGFNEKKMKVIQTILTVSFQHFENL